jgi:cyclase
VVLSIDAKRVDGSFKVFAKGGRENTGIDLIEWVKRGVNNGAGEIVLNSIDTDGVKKGFDLEMLKAVTDVVKVPVIASGGAGNVKDFIDLFKANDKVDAGLAASIFHFGEVKINELKKELDKNGITVRL